MELKAWFPQGTSGEFLEENSGILQEGTLRTNPNMKWKKSFV